MFSGWVLTSGGAVTLSLAYLSAQRRAAKEPLPQAPRRRTESDDVDCLSWLSLSTSDGATECTTDGAAEYDIVIGLFFVLGPLFVEGPTLEDESVISGEDIASLV